MTAEPNITRVGQIAIRVNDPQKAAAFYRDVLGLRLLFEVPPTMAFFDCGGVRLMLSKPEGPGTDHPASIIYYSVADIHHSAQALAQRGVAFEQEPHRVAKMANGELWMAFFRDVDHNLLALTCEISTV